MKKSCSVKESKVVTAQGVDNVLNVSKEESKEQLTEEQLLINQKLLESGIADEGLGWLEKRNIFKTINVSLDTAGSERLQRSSPRLAKSTNPRQVKWIENSFEAGKHEALQSEKISETKSKPNKKDSDCTLSRKSSCALTSKNSNQETKEFMVKPNCKIESSSCEKSHKDNEISFDCSKSSKKVHYIKIQVEGNSKEKCNSVEGIVQGVSLGKKRASQPEIETTEAPKKFKMEETNNGVCAEKETPLKTELEMEIRKHNAPFKLRDIKTIVSECDIRNKKWKETFLKFKCPTRWGIPIVRNCSEKWDGKQVPPKLLHRYQKYLSTNNLTHPVFLPAKSPNNVNFSKSSCEISSQSSMTTSSECRDESEDLVEGSFIRDESNNTELENNLNASTSAKNTTGGMVLRNRNNNKTVISDVDEFSESEDSDDWLMQQKSSKKQKGNFKCKKSSERSNKQLVLKLEKCNINKGSENEGGRKNGNKNDIGITGGSVMSTNAINQTNINSKSVPDPDTMVCPICSHRFKKQLIESHATECASKTYKD